MSRSRRTTLIRQPAGAVVPGRPELRGRHDNPIESGFPFANAALGVYSSYGQQSAFIEKALLPTLEGMRNLLYQLRHPDAR